MHSATKFTIALAVVIIVILAVVVAGRESLIPYRGMPNGRFSYSAVDWEDPEWSNIFALRGVGGPVPDECHADVMGPDIVRIDEKLTEEDREFAKQNGLKLAAPSAVGSGVMESRSDTSSTMTQGTAEGFTCAAMATEKSAAMLAMRQAPIIHTRAANPLLSINTALQKKIWDPVIVTGSGYSVKV